MIWRTIEMESCRRDFESVFTEIETSFWVHWPTSKISFINQSKPSMKSFISNLGFLCKAYLKLVCWLLITILKLLRLKQGFVFILKYLETIKHLFYILIDLNFPVIKFFRACFMTQHVNRFAMNNEYVYLYLNFNFQSTIKWSFRGLAHGKISTLQLIAVCEPQHHPISKPNFAKPAVMTVSWLLQTFT